MQTREIIYPTVPASLRVGFTIKSLTTGQNTKINYVAGEADDWVVETEDGTVSWTDGTTTFDVVSDN